MPLNQCYFCDLQFLDSVRHTNDALKSVQTPGPSIFRFRQAHKNDPPTSAPPQSCPISPFRYEHTWGHQNDVPNQGQHCDVRFLDSNRHTLGDTKMMPSNQRHHSDLRILDSDRHTRCATEMMARLFVDSAATRQQLMSCWLGLDLQNYAMDEKDDVVDDDSVSISRFPAGMRLILARTAKIMFSILTLTNRRMVKKWIREQAARDDQDENDPQDEDSLIS